MIGRKSRQHRQANEQENLQHNATHLLLNTATTTQHNYYIRKTQTTTMFTSNRHTTHMHTTPSSPPSAVVDTPAQGGMRRKHGIHSYAKNRKPR